MNLLICADTLLNNCPVATVRSIPQPPTAELDLALKSETSLSPPPFDGTYLCLA